MRVPTFHAADETPARQDTVSGLTDLFNRVQPSVAHKPLVLAFASHLAIETDAQSEEADIERLRAEVRGLGVTLLIVSPGAARCFESNDCFHTLKAWHAADRLQLRSVFDQFGLPLSKVSSARGLLAVFVIDLAGAIRFVHVASPETALAPFSNDLMLRGLVASSKAFERQRISGPRLSLAELTTRALVTGFEDTLPTGSSAEGVGGRRDSRPATASQRAS